jgi:hypothetical protein
MDKAYMLWSLHYLEAERESRGYPRAFMNFDQFLETPKEEFARIERALGMSFPVSPDSAASCLQRFLSKDLRHHTEANDEDRAGPLQQLATDLHGQLLRAGSYGNDRLDRGELDGLWQRMEAIQHSFAAPLVEHLRQTSQKRGELQLTVNRLVRSWSWYTGKPVRLVERLLGRQV